MKVEDVLSSHVPYLLRGLHAFLKCFSNVVTLAVVEPKVAHHSHCLNLLESVNVSAWSSAISSFELGLVDSLNGLAAYALIELPLLRCEGDGALHVSPRWQYQGCLWSPKQQATGQALQPLDRFIHSITFPEARDIPVEIILVAVWMSLEKFEQGREVLQSILNRRSCDRPSTLSIQSRRVTEPFVSCCCELCGLCQQSEKVALSRLRINRLPSSSTKRLQRAEKRTDPLGILPVRCNRVIRGENKVDAVEILQTVKTRFPVMSAPCESSWDEVSKILQAV